ncbi:diguanylate cyclase (GGDEF domain) with PAS/PAC sensor [Pseudoalteromonas luteoviolacea B = ATCC 29581]|nr:diguanylate cyclase (GGDEF domain) with PAS/PAC sensor [Pseudoalteromonas luteoviolacea B = ATCC 29581]
MEKALRCGHEWAIALTEQLDEVALDAILQKICSDMVGEDGFSIWLNKTFNSSIEPVCFIGQSELSIQALQHVMAKAQTLRADQFFFTYKADLVLPIRHRQQVYGWVMLDRDVTLSPNAPVVLAYLCSVYINQAATLHHARLDPLTELLNRQTFEQKVIQIMAGEGFIPPREDQPTRTWYLAMVDIDHFKRVNDTFGHVIGDEVILLVAQLLKRNFRAEDYVFRYGGEEFAILFQCLSEDDARNTLERGRSVVSEYRFPQVEQVTISTGFVDVSDFCQVTALVHQADLALYESKHLGRNKVTAYVDLNRAEQAPTDTDIELF